MKTLTRPLSRYIFVTGGVLSSLGKGTLAASVGALLKQVGFSVRLCKVDPYLNLDPGTMNPFEHGEVFVTNDGGETDLDFGHYERFTGIEASKSDSTTTGKIFTSIIAKERRGEYNGETVQIVPHFCWAVHDFIMRNDGVSDFIICEVGGTVGDIEGQSFIEALRQMRVSFGALQTMFVHLVPMYFLETTNETKTKPAQHSVRQLLGLGIQPDLLCCRTRTPLDLAIKTKLARACNLEKSNIISASDVELIYQVPKRIEEEGILTRIQEHFQLPVKQADMSPWIALEDTLQSSAKAQPLHIAIIGKYIQFDDTYRSLKEAIWHSAAHNNRALKIHWISVDNHTEESLCEKLSKVDGIIVPGGFGLRGINMKITAVNFAIANNVPFLGICLGLQALALAVAGHAKLPNPISEEFHPEDQGSCIIKRLSQWHNVQNTLETHTSGYGNLRLGSFPVHIEEGAFLRTVYGEAQVSERFRHRYAVNLEHVEALKSEGLTIAAMSKDNIVSAIEHKDQKFCIGVQFHPEFRSSPFAPHPLFTGFVRAAIQQSSNT